MRAIIITGKICGISIIIIECEAAGVLHSCDHSTWLFFLHHGWACGSGRGVIKHWTCWRGVCPSQCSTPHARPLMRVSLGGVLPVHASAKPYLDCLVSLWSSTHRAIPIGSTFGRLGLLLFRARAGRRLLNAHQHSYSHKYRATSITV